MNFRHKHIADSVTERIQAIADHVRTGSAMPQSKGAATVQLERSDNGDLLVTKTFENGEPEVLTISGSAPVAGLPPGYVDITPQAEPQAEAPLLADVASGGIVENAALGGNAIDSLLGA